MERVERITKIERLNFISFGIEEEIILPNEANSNDSENLINEPPELPYGMNLIAEDALQEMLANAKKEGHSQGYNEGVIAAEEKAKNDLQTRDENIKSVLDLIANRITIAAETHTANINKQNDAMQKLIMVAAKKIAGNSIKDEPYQIVESLIKLSSILISGNTKIIIKVAPILIEVVKERIENIRQIISGFEGEIIIEEDKDLSEFDCRVEWKNGYAEHNNEKLCQDIEQIISRIFSKGT
ncbi:MAG: hypothetical protein WCJ33_05545 [Pseudomonadota bacterium]